MHDRGKSDDLVVPKKPPNDDRAAARPEEAVEGRRSAKGNSSEQTRVGAQHPGPLQHALARVRQASVRTSREKLTTLFHHVYDIERLRKAFHAQRADAAPGPDGVTKAIYGAELEKNLADLSDRLRRGAYRARAVRRVYIPKPDGGQRPLGVPTFEDRLVQRAMAEVLSAVYEPHFVGYSYGFRSGRSAHNALDAVWVAITDEKVNWVLDADIRAFFDMISHEWLIRFLEHRIADQRVIRLIQKWLKAGVLDQDGWHESETGTPQGGSISPLLANLYLHYVLDLWASEWRRQNARGKVYIVRYADDFVVGFQYLEDAQRFWADLRTRFANYGLALHPTKTRLIEFGRFAAANRTRRKQGKPETFDFLGFTHMCSRTTKGRFIVRRKTVRKRFTRKLREIRDQLVARMHEPVHEVGEWLQAVYQGWLNYHAIPHNYAALAAMRQELGKAWRQVLRRRSQRSRMTWERMRPLIELFLPTPRILHPWPNQRLRVTT